MRRRELYGDDPHGEKEFAAGLPAEKRKKYEKLKDTAKRIQKGRHGINREPSWVANERTLTKPEKKEKEKVGQECFIQVTVMEKLN